MLVDEYAGFLIDLDGVVYVGDEPVRGAIEAIERLRDAGRPFRFVTNSSSATRAEVAHKLSVLGIPADEEEVVSAAWVTATQLTAREIERVFVVGNDSLRRQLSDAGIANTREDSEAVVVGHHDGLTYSDLVTATRLLDANEIPLIAVNADPRIPRPDGIVPGVGAIVRALETATDRTAEVIGKPAPHLFELAIDSLGTDDVVMIGDSPTVDIVGAHRAGISAILATTHAYEYEEITPDATIDTLLDLFAGR